MATSLRESRDFLSRWLVGGGGPFEDTAETRDGRLSDAASRRDGVRLRRCDAPNAELQAQSDAAEQIMNQ